LGSKSRTETSRASGARIGAGALGAGLAKTALTALLSSAPRWHYEDGLVAMALAAHARASDDRAAEQAALNPLASLIGADGSISGYREDEYNLDQINPGKNLFALLESTGERRFGQALDRLRGQLERQPRTPSGGFWHKLIYPNQMWLDGLYMAQPFAALYARHAGRSADYDDIAVQFELMERGARDQDSGLLRHAWDESRAQPWADPATGKSPNVWGRAMGWFAMALVDTLEHFPATHPRRPSLLAILQRTAKAILDSQDPSGMWYQLPALPREPGNYLESSCSAMFAYALAKASRLGFLDGPIWNETARRALDGIRSRAISVDYDGSLHLEGTCAVAGLGGKPYRDGSIAYYLGEPVRRDDFKGLGPLILACLELEVS